MQKMTNLSQLIEQRRQDGIQYNYQKRQTQCKIFNSLEKLWRKTYQVLLHDPGDLGKAISYSWCLEMHQHWHSKDSGTILYTFGPGTQYLLRVCYSDCIAVDGQEHEVISLHASDKTFM